MKQKNQAKNPYDTNRGGKISAPTSVGAGDPTASVKRGDDLRK